MTREEKLWSMNGHDLIGVAKKLGVKLNTNKTETGLKESKEKAIQKILAAEAATKEIVEQPTEEIVETTEVVEAETAEVVEVEQTAEAEEPVEPKKEKKVKKSKKTFEELIIDIPAPADADVHFIKSREGYVHVKIGTDKKKLFGYSGVIIIVTNKLYLDNLDYETKSYGFRVAPTQENMKTLFNNYFTATGKEI